MGTCASSQHTSKGGQFQWQSRVNIVHMDGRIQQFKKPLKTEHVLLQNPNTFICCSDSIYVGSLMPHVGPNEELKMGEIYFLMPLSKSHVPVSLQDLGALAIKANAALAHSQATHSILN